MGTIRELTDSVASWAFLEAAWSPMPGERTEPSLALQSARMTVSAEGEEGRAESSVSHQERI